MDEAIKQSYLKYLTEEKCLKPRSVKDYMQIADDVGKRLDVRGELSYKQINDTVRDLKEHYQWSQGTVYKYSICVRHFFRWLQREGYRPDNPYPFADWKKPRAKTPKYLTEADFFSIIDDPSLSLSELSLLYLLWDSGARIGEIAQLTHDNIDLERRLVTIPYEVSKGSYSYRSVPITAKTCQLLTDLKEKLVRRGHNRVWFINAQNEPMTVSGLQKVIANIGMRQSPLRPLMRLSPHQFRHSTGIRWISAGISEIIVQKWLGHQSLDMTARYVHVSADASLDIFNKFFPQAQKA